jgi:hypothetical protein
VLFISSKISVSLDNVSHNIRISPKSGWIDCRLNTSASIPESAKYLPAQSGSAESGPAAKFRPTVTERRDANHILWS